VIWPIRELSHRLGASGTARNPEDNALARNWDGLLGIGEAAVPRLIVISWRIKDSRVFMIWARFVAATRRPRHLS